MRLKLPTQRLQKKNKSRRCHPSQKETRLTLARSPHERKRAGERAEGDGTMARCDHCPSPPSTFAETGGGSGSTGSATTVESELRRSIGMETSLCATR